MFFSNWQSGRVKFLSQTFFLLAACVVLTPAFAADEKSGGKLTIEIPAEVQTTIDREKADGKVLDFKRVNESDGTTYVVGLLIDGAHYALNLDSGGRVMRKELDEVEPGGKPATLETIPLPVRKTILREAHGAEIKEIDVTEVRKTFSVEVSYDGRKFRIDVDAAGRLVRKEVINDGN
ncbi:MAG: hypothetical protein K8R23_10695 [Chthoniobacter sp.]|nr:hypothetical protein [Chthoniobacter sp.]